jgi:hypothetical protein
MHQIALGVLTEKGRVECMASCSRQGFDEAEYVPPHLMLRKKQWESLATRNSLTLW